MRKPRVGTIVGSLLTVLLALTACTSTDAKRPIAPPSPKGPGGNGGLLVGARWRVQWIGVGGQKIMAPPDAAAWIEFGYGDTAEGNSGCTPFKAATTVTATALTVGRRTEGTAESGRCPASYHAFEEKLRKLFNGPLTINQRVDALTLDLKNQKGDYVAVKLLRPQRLFDTRWRLQRLIVSDANIPITGGKEVYYVFHRDGTVTGKAGCNDFKGEATFHGLSLTLDRLTRTSHRTCSRDLMDQEEGLVNEGPRTMEIIYATSTLLQVVDQTQGLNYFGYEWVAIPGT